MPNPVDYLKMLKPAQPGDVPIHPKAVLRHEIWKLATPLNGLRLAVGRLSKTHPDSALLAIESELRAVWERLMAYEKVIIAGESQPHEADALLRDSRAIFAAQLARYLEVVKGISDYDALPDVPRRPFLEATLREWQSASVTA